MAQLTGQGLANFAQTKLGTPYFYGSKLNILTEQFMSLMHMSYPGTVTLSYMQKARNQKQVGKTNVDCSGLIGGYRKKQVGSAQLRSSARARMPISKIKEFAIGTVLWKEGHVGVYIGMENGVPMCVEAKGINYGTVKTKASATKWKEGLTFSDIDYTYDNSVVHTKHEVNPYKEPTTVILKKGSKGEGVKWLQYELVEAGYKLTIDGIFGSATETALIKFQKSAKIMDDGECGKITRQALKLDT